MTLGWPSQGLNSRKQHQMETALHPRYSASRVSLCSRSSAASWPSFSVISTRDAHERGERPSAMATAGTILGWIGLIVPLAAFVILFFTGLGWPSGVAMAVLIAAISALVIYLRRNNRR